MEERKIIQFMVRNAVIAALYFVLTVVLAPISYDAIQVRLAEFLMLLCFFRKDYIFGLTLGCCLANIFSTLGFMDMIFGTLATFLSCLVICFCKHLVVASIAPIVFNAFIVGAELYVVLEATEASSYFIFAGQVALGELIALTIGYILFMILGKREYFQRLIDTNQNFRFKF